jgi:hypothetical protein
MSFAENFELRAENAALLRKLASAVAERDALRAEVERLREGNQALQEVVDFWVKPRLRSQAERVAAEREGGAA